MTSGMFNWTCLDCKEEIIRSDLAAFLHALEEHKVLCKAAPLFPPSEPAEAQGPEWQERSAEFETFDEAGDEVVGVLTAIDVIKLQDRDVCRAKVQTKDKHVGFLLTVQLEPLLINVPIGTMVKVVYQGEVKSSKGRRVKTFKVWTKQKEVPHGA